MTEPQIVDGFIMTIDDDDGVIDNNIKLPAKNPMTKSIQSLKPKGPVMDGVDFKMQNDIDPSNRKRKTPTAPIFQFEETEERNSQEKTKVGRVNKRQNSLLERVQNRLDMAAFYRQQKIEKGELKEDSDIGEDIGAENPQESDQESEDDILELQVDGMEDTITVPELDDDDDEDDDEDGEDDDDDEEEEDDEDEDESEDQSNSKKSIIQAKSETKNVNIALKSEPKNAKQNIISTPNTTSTSDNAEKKAPEVTDYDVKGNTLAQSFSSFQLSRTILRAVSDLSFHTPTAVQSHVIPMALSGRDILASAVTGSGKTAAFLLPILERLLWRERRSSSLASRVLILLPTRELADQCHAVAVSLTKYTDIRSCLIVGGLSANVQEAELRTRPDIIIATPGRLIDHLRNTLNVHLDDVEILVLDEADRLCELGFVDELNEIIQHCPRGRQTMLFSATMNTDVSDLILLSLNNPVRINVDPTLSLTARLTQEFVRIRPGHEGEREAILIALCKRTFTKKTMIFSQSKSACHRLMILFAMFKLNATELQGNLTQAQRMDALNAFREGTVDFLICTDLASRGLDVPGVENVINISMPKELKLYIHRVGRTARAGRHGKAITLCGESDRKLMRQLLRQQSSNDVIQSRVIPPHIITHYKSKIADIEGDISAVLEGEAIDKAERVAEMEVNKAKNVMIHRDEILSRPMRTWFQTEQQKLASKLSAVRLHSDGLSLAASAKPELDDGEDHDDEDGDDEDSGKSSKGKAKSSKDKKNPFQGLSRAQKRRKLMRIEAEQDAQQRIREAQSKRGESASVDDIQVKDPIRMAEKMNAKAKHSMRNSESKKRKQDQNSGSKKGSTKRVKLYAQEKVDHRFDVRRRAEIKAPKKKDRGGKSNKAFKSKSKHKRR